MNIATHQIPNPLIGKAALYIESIHEYRFLSNHPAELLPQGRFEMIFQLDGDFLHQSTPDSDWFSRPRAFIGGLHAQAYSVQSLSTNGRCLGVSLKPEMVHHLIREKLNVFENSVVDLEAIFGAAGRHLSSSLTSDDDLISKTKRLQEFFMHYSNDATSSKSPQLIFEALSLSDDCRVADMCAQSGLSESYFRKLFREKVGMSAKRYFKIRRINRAIALIRNHPSMQLTEITYALGFFDQAHFIREFKSITGKSPKEYQS
jgi:AraC-like DNA-binding protein